MATQTADGKYAYQKVYPAQTHSIADMVIACHKALSLASKWSYVPLKPGVFGYDNMVHSIGMLLDNYEPGMDIDELSDLIHQGWVNNYVYWRDNQPFKTNTLYIKPGSPLGDARRNSCASTPYQSLPEDEKEKDRIVARTINKLIVA